ncbi:MAG TPA: hypothetical protein VJ725_18830 [Thermoanaerobaculia bacterium]|nr:hypothetical protein [Thermoanaerobaculia bacterium]
MPSGASASSSTAPIQRRGDKGKRRRRRKKQWKAQKRAWKRAEEQGVEDTASEPEETDPDDAAWETSLAATEDLLPKDYAAVKQANLHDEDGPEALTSFSQKGKQIRVGYNPDVPSSNRNKRIGRLAQTFTHELAVHGKNAGDKDADEEHGEMHDPDTRGEYLSASHRTFNRLENASQKKTFAQSWHADMNNQIAWDEDATNKEKGLRRVWALERRNSMLDAIRKPEKHAWTTEEDENEENEEDQERREVHAPETRREHLDAAHETFNSLGSAAQKRAFVKSWHSDVNSQINLDETLGKGEKRARRDWVLKRRNSMINAIQHPEKHEWAEEET